MGHTILIVEDDEDIRALAVMILEMADYTVLGAGTGEEGLRLLGGQSIDLAILDVNLPGIDGWEVCRRLRAMPETATLPIAFFTVRNMRNQQDAQAFALANGFINKPFERGELLSTVQRLLETPSPRSVEPA